MARLYIYMPMICVFFLPALSPSSSSPKAFLRRWHRQNGRAADSHRLATAGHRLCISRGAGRGAGALWTRKPWWADPDQAAVRFMLPVFWWCFGTFWRIMIGFEWDIEMVDLTSMLNRCQVDDFFCGETDAEGLKNVWVLKQSGISLE